MDKNTKQYLNSKVWYRFLKVFYFLIFISLVLLSSIYPIEEYNSKFDNESSYILCEDQRTLGLDENNIFLYSSYIDYSTNQRIKSMCAYNPNDPININPDRVDDLKRLTPMNQNYELVDLYLSRDWIKTGFVICLIILAYLIIFEIFRRIFYYIILGTFNPKK